MLGSFPRIKQLLTRSFLRQLIATFTCNLGVVAAGPCFSWLEPLTTWLTSQESPISMTQTDVSWLTASVEFGEILGAILSAILADRWGRKPAILCIGPLTVLSWLLVVFTRDLIVLYLVRIVQGVAMGIAFTVVPMYIAEISSPSVRGALGAQFTVFWFLGILYSYITGHYFSYYYYIYIQLILPLIFFLSFMLMPESPYYYYMVGNRERAFESLSWIREGESDVREEASSIEKAVQDDMKNKGSFGDLIRTKSDRRALFIVQIVTFVRYMTGMPVYISYASETFSKSAQGLLTADQLTIAMGSILCISALLSSCFSDTVGRRPLMIASSIGMFVFNTLLAVYYYLDEKTAIDISSLVWLMYISVAGFCISINMGVGQLLQTVQAEFFPSNTRAVGCAVTGVSSSVTTFINLILYHSLNELFGVYMNFLTFGIFSFFGTLMIMKYVTESAGKSLAEINTNIKDITSK